MEMRLINANKIKYREYRGGGGREYPENIVTEEEIAQMPTVDAVEVVRCKDCKHWEQYNACDGTKPHRCMNHDAIFYKRTNPNDFCSYGERKDND